MTDRNVSSSRHQDPRLGESGPSSGDVLARRLTQVVAGVFIVVGILGFIPGVTTDYDSLQLAGHESEAMLLGVFQVSVLHNVVHLLFGVVGLLMSARGVTAAAYLIGGGAVYLVLWVYGLVVGQEDQANFVPLNTADNWLHLGLGVGMIALGLVALRAVRGAIGSQTPM